MTDVQEDVTLEAHIRAIDEGASDVFSGILDSVRGIGGFLVGAGEGVAEAFSNATAAAGVFGGIAVGVFKETVDSAATYAEAVAKVAFLTGETTAQSSGLISAFRAQGFTTDEATNSMQRLTMRLGGIDQQFRSTGKLSASAKIQLKELGLTAQDLTKHGSDLSAQLPKIIDHLKNMKDPLERDRISMQLFGRNFASIAPLIDAGGAAFARAEGDANRFGVSLSEDQVHAMEAYKSALETTKEAIQGVTLQIGFYALPYFQKLEDIIKQGIAWWEALSPSVHKSMLEFLKVAAVFGTLFGGASALEKVVLPLVRNVPLLGSAFEGLLGPVIPFLGIIGPLVGLFILLNDKLHLTGPLLNLIGPIVYVARDAFNAFLGVAQAVLTIFNTLTVGGADHLRGSILDLALTLQANLFDALSTLTVWLTNLQTWIYTNRDAIEAWATRLATFATDLANFGTTVVGTVLADVTNLATFITTTLAAALGGVQWPAVDATVEAAWHWLKDNGVAVGKAIEDIAIGYAAIKTVGTISAVVTSVYNFASAFTAVAAQEGLAIALQRTLGIEAAVNAAKATAAWIAHGVAAVASAVSSAAGAAAAWLLGTTATDAEIVAMGTETEATYAAMGMAGEEHASQGALAWVASGVKTAAAGAVTAVKWVASQVVMGAGAVASAAGAAAAWLAASAVAVASAVRAAAAWLLANGAMIVVRAATIAWTVVQWLLNAALTANPIGLIVLAIALLVAGVILAYQHSSVFRGIVNALWADLQKLGAWITGTLFPALGKFFSWLGTTASGIVTGVGSAFSGLGTTVHNVWDGITSGIKGFINQIIDHINTFIRGINAMGSAIQAIPGVPHFGAIPAIPHLYTGAVVTQPTLAMVGDRGTEVVATLAQAFQAGAAAVRGGGVGGGGMVTIEFHVDGRLIERKVTKITGQRVRLQGGGLGSAA